MPFTDTIVSFNLRHNEHYCNCHARDSNSPIHTHTPFSRTTQGGPVLERWNQSGFYWNKRQSEWQWHKLGYMQVCTSLQTDNHTSTSPLKFFTGRMPFLPPTQQRQSTESNSPIHYYQYCDNCNNYDDYNNDDDYSDYYYYFYNHCNCCCCGCYRCCPAAHHTVQYTAAAI